tara:strand:- start:1243 stop:1563 length:321 start_codon:yes stop_codon:yes gene_type:complete
MRLIVIIVFFILTSCGVPPEDWQNTRPGSDEQWMASMDASMEKWIVASQHLPKEKLEGLYSAGFFEIQDAIYSHHCDSKGNMLRLKYNEENKTWKQIKYETFGCGE